MNHVSSDEFEERFRRMITEARRMEERLTRALKEFEHTENCIIPLYELRPTSDGYSLTVDLPGVKKEEVGLTIKGSFIGITAPCKSATARKRRSNRELNYFIEVALPPETDTKGIRASMKKGLLTVHLKKRTGGHKIKVE